MAFLVFPGLYEAFHDISKALQPAYTLPKMEEYLDKFERVFGSKPDLAYSKDQIENIPKNRRKLENELFFDKLLRAVGIEDPQNVYPPTSNASLRSLYESITSSSSPSHQTSSLIYYLLKDLPLSRSTSTQYARSQSIPPKYTIFIDGIWALDHLDLKTAVGHLCSPQLTPTFPSEILYHICHLSRPDEFEHGLVYYHTTSPPLTNKKVLEAFFKCYLRASITEAFFFARTHPPEIHQILLEQLISFVHTDAGGEIRAQRAEEFLALPMERKENVWCEEYLRGGNGKGLFGAKDTLVMKGLERGKVEGMEGGKMVEGVNWGVLGEGLK